MWRVLSCRRLFDIDLYVSKRTSPREREKRWNPFVIERWDNTLDGDYCMQMNSSFFLSLVTRQATQMTHTHTDTIRIVSPSPSILGLHYTSSRWKHPWPAAHWNSINQVSACLLSLSDQWFVPECLVDSLGILSSDQRKISSYRRDKVILKISFLLSLSLPFRSPSQ